MVSSVAFYQSHRLVLRLFSLLDLGMKIVFFIRLIYYPKNSLLQRTHAHA